jgi:hypothetical protein
MASHEWHISHDEISDPQKVTQRNIKEFEKHGYDIHKLEVDKIEDDHEKKVRILRVRPRKYFGPWSHRG